jgi:hypothetical protein
MDPGSNIHVINNTEFWNWTHSRHGTADETLLAGSQSVQISEWGTVLVPIRTPSGIHKIQLTSVALVKGFFANILSLSRCMDMKIHFDSGRNLLYQATPNNIIALLDYQAGHWLIDADDGKRPNASLLITMATFKPSRDPKPDLQATATEAHHIWAHPGPDTIRHLQRAVRGFKLQGSDPPPSWKECEDCILTKMNQQISRRIPDTVATQPFERIAIDLVYLVPQGEECYNGDKFALHAVRVQWVDHKCKVNSDEFDEEELTRRKAGLIYLARRGSRSFYTVFQGFSEVPPKATGQGIPIRALAPYTNELALAAVQLLNTTPIESLGWKTPHEVIFDTKPSVAHYSPIGCRAYVYRRDIKAADKTEPRAHIGYLVGYDSFNIFRVWIPSLDRVIRTRDVIFKWQFTYKHDALNDNNRGKIAEQEVETLDLEQPQFTATTDDLYTTEQFNRHLQEIENSTAHASQPNIEKEQRPMDSTRGTMSPQRSPSPDNSTIVLSRPTPLTQSHRHANEIPGYLPNRHNNNAPQTFNPDIGDQNVITGGRRSRAPPVDYRSLSGGRGRGRSAGNNGVSSNFFTYYGTFATALHPTLHQKITSIVPKTKLHRDQMPEPPKRFKDVANHPQADMYWKKEMDDCWKKECFQNTKATTFTADAEILPPMWVYTNKFDEDGYFLKAKARLVVRGDLQLQMG